MPISGNYLQRGLLFEQLKGTVRSLFICINTDKYKYDGSVLKHDIDFFIDYTGGGVQVLFDA